MSALHDMKKFTVFCPNFRFCFAYFLERQTFTWWFHFLRL